MSKRLVTGTARQRERNIFICPGNSSMRRVSYGRIRLDGRQSQVRFSNPDHETGLICLKGACTITVRRSAL